MKQYTTLYNAGEYAKAVSFLSGSVESSCGGPGGLASALEQNHEIEQIDYEVKSVNAWGADDPNMADVATREIYSGTSQPITLGLAFTFQNGVWKLNDLYPLGTGAFC
jgi:hypothetical protein